MKKTVLFIVLLFQVSVAIGQTDWGPWAQNPCYKGLFFRCKVKDYNDSAKQYTWDVEIKSNYGTKVSVNFDIANSSIDGRITIEPGKTDKSWTLNPSNTSLYIEFSKVCFHHPDGFDQCSEYDQKGYASFADCDLGTPKYHVYNGVNANNNATNATANTQNTTTTQQNSQAEYDRSKAEMDAKLAQANAEIQRQNQENANKLRIYNAAVQAGVAAHNSANYTEAKRQFTIAINNASPQDRSKAQEYYNASVNAEKGQAKIQAISDLTTTTINALDQYQKAKEEQRRVKAEEERLAQEQLQREREQQAIITGQMEAQWQRAHDYANLGTNEGYQTAINMQLPYARAGKLDGWEYNSLGLWYWKLEDYINAMEWYRKGDSMGNPDACANIGVLYYHGTGAEQNKGLALAYFQKACTAGLERACKNFKNVREELEAASENSGGATFDETYYVAETYYTEKNYQDALKYYTRAYETDARWDAALKIADMYVNENQLNDWAPGAKWYAAAVNLMENDPKEKNGIGTRNAFDDKYTDALFSYASTVKNVNGKLAIELYLKAVREGFTGAYTQIGLLYDLGKGGIEKDWQQAATYYQKDAAKNAAKAMHLLGLLYETGGPNLEKDKSESKKWHKMACKADKKYCD